MGTGLKKGDFMALSTLPLGQLITNFVQDKSEKNAKLLYEGFPKSNYYIILTEAPKPADLSNPDFLDTAPLDLIDFQSSKGSIVPVFTDKDELGKQKLSRHAIQISFQGLLKLLRAHKEIGFLLFNPEGTPITFDKESFLGSFQEARVSSHTDTIEAGVAVSFFEDVHEAKPEAVLSLAKTAALDPDIARLWLVRTQEEGQPEGWGVIADIDSGDLNKTIPVASAFLSVQKAGPMRAFLADDELVSKVVETFKPVYIRK